MKKIKNNLKDIIGFFLMAIPLMVLAVFFLFQPEYGAKASTPGGLSISTSTTYRILIGSTTAQTIATSTPSNNNCSATIITTGPRDMFFLIGSSSPVSPVVNGLGHLQAASTTVAYPSENYGCGNWTAVSYEVSSSNASTSVTVTRTY